MESNTSELLASTNVSPELAEKLKKLQPGSYCHHRSWGTGRIQSWNVELEQVIIDFPGKSGHGMEFEYATQSLQSLPEDHVEVRVLGNKDEVKAQAENDPTALIQNFVKSYGSDATVDQVEKILVPVIIPAEGWKKWWDSAKRALKKDSRFEVPSRRTLPIVFHDTPLDHLASAVEETRKAVGLKALNVALQKVEKNWKSSDDKTVAEEIVTLVNQALSTAPKSQTSAAVELVLTRDDFIATAGLSEATGLAALATYISTDAAQLFKLIDSLPSIKQVRLLERARVIYGERWAEIFHALVPDISGRLMDVVVDTFRKEDRLGDLLATLQRLVHERRLNPDLLVWICKNRDTEVSSLIGPQLFSAVLSVLEYDQLADYKKGTKLHDLVINDKSVIRDILASASHEEVRDLTRAILLTPVFEELNKRSLLASIVKLYPFIQNMIIGDNKSEGQALVVSWESLKRRKAELEEVVNKKIPENTKDIAIARSYGDLRENSEFKAAKEMQTVLMRRKAELEAQITTAQGTDFKGVSADEVNIGTIVTVEEEEGKKKITYTILGAWDSKPEAGIISYLSAIAKELISRKVGDTVEMPIEGTTRRKVTITEIKPYNP